MQPSGLKRRASKSRPTSVALTLTLSERYAARFRLLLDQQEWAEISNKGNRSARACIDSILHVRGHHMVAGRSAASRSSNLTSASCSHAKTRCRARMPRIRPPRTARRDAPPDHARCHRTRKPSAAALARSMKNADTSGRMMNATVAAPCIFVTAVMLAIAVGVAPSATPQKPAEITAAS